MHLYKKLCLIISNRILDNDITVHCLVFKMSSPLNLPKSYNSFLKAFIVFIQKSYCSMQDLKETENYIILDSPYPVFYCAQKIDFYG